MKHRFSFIQQQSLLRHFFLINYLLALAITMPTVDFSEASSAGPQLFLLLAALCYGVIYLLPPALLTGLAAKLGHWGKNAQVPTLWWPVYSMAVLSSSTTQLFLYANAKIHALYGMYFNGFILNLLVTPGGIESLGGSSASSAGFVVVACGFVAIEAILLAAMLALHKRTTWVRLPNRFYRWSLATWALLALGLHAYYAFDAYTSARLSALAESIPFFQPVTAKTLLARLGIEGNPHRNLAIQGKLNYPMHPLAFRPPTHPYNIVWLVSESWRADTLNREIMPNTWRFAQGARRYTHNYSGGNGTRMGVFSMFMGMPGNYWFPFLRERRGAAIIDVLQQQGYQMGLYTSAHFSYPEFDKTIFSGMPASVLHEQAHGQGWERDRDNVSDMLRFIDRREKTRPFFSFMFFESPHARYYFPPESVIRSPYRDDINYATLNKETLAKDITGIRNRYLNSVHHLDREFGRVFDYLRENRLLDSTVVVLVGDHGEEFMEHGFWGHNSTFVDEQIRTPLVLHVPGAKPLVSNQMTSHMDIVPTLMPLLGVSNPAGDFALGYNLLGDTQRDHAYVSDWNRLVYIDNEVKITQSVNIKSYTGIQTSSAHDLPLVSTLSQQLIQRKQPALMQLMHDMGRFLQHGH